MKSQLFLIQEHQRNASPQKNVQEESKGKAMLVLQERLEDLHNKIQQQKAYFKDIIEELKDKNR